MLNPTNVFKSQDKKMSSSDYQKLAESGKSPYEVYLIARQEGNALDVCKQMLMKIFGLCRAEAEGIAAIGSGIAALSALHRGTNVLALVERELCLYHEAAWFHGKYIELLSDYLQGELTLPEFEAQFKMQWQEMRVDVIDAYDDVFDREARLAADIVTAIDDEDRCQPAIQTYLQHALDTFIYLGWSA
jgi:hypothetical protein